MDVADAYLEHARDRLHTSAQSMGLFDEAAKAPLPPMRDINHEILIIDESKCYHWRPSKCPVALEEQWIAKHNDYLETGRWEMTTAKNTVPMLPVFKPHKPANAPELRTIFDLRERNQNTVKLPAPLPSIEDVLWRVAGKPFVSTMDLQACYEQIRVVETDVRHNVVNTPDGNMRSNVMLQGDCNATATCRTLMNQLFGPYIGVFMDMYLDDIIVYSDTLSEHLEHVQIIFDILQRECFYLSEKKCHFLAKEVTILGHVVDDGGIRMDPAKVDEVIKWKTPTSKEMLRAFLGSVGFLADDIASVRIPMGILHELTGVTSSFRWTETHQRAFEEVRDLVQRFRDHKRVRLTFRPGSPPVNVVTDASYTGIAGVISQGDDWRTANVVAFFSAKLNPAQQNYPVHEQEMLAGLETMLRYQYLLQGVPFTWYTDHKSLTHLLTQAELRGRRARWAEQLADFDFKVVNVAGVENILSDALSRMYANDAPGTVRSPSEYPQHDEWSTPLYVRPSPNELTCPVLVGLEAAAMSTRSKTGSLPKKDDAAVPVGVKPPSKGESSTVFAKRMAAKPFRVAGPKSSGDDLLNQLFGNGLAAAPTVEVLVPSESTTNTVRTSERTVVDASEMPDLVVLPEDESLDRRARAAARLASNIEDNQGGAYASTSADPELMQPVISLVGLLNEKMLGINLLDIILVLGNV